MDRPYFTSSPPSIGGPGPALALRDQAFSDVDQVIGDHSEADPAPHSIHAVISAARQSMTAL
jgi:hypothetical protein